ncbi:1-acylglycerol-3-phosphate O-acyltransferase [Neptunicella sp. SCSIO 80796]|uniref:1-acylglycerol-3-phosphate O-acyltransferase n=1 Tax=Neptunicella plasticusilytica TaxID=3117012 RepID=UPI003A4D1D35
MIALIRIPFVGVYFILINLFLILVCLCRPFHRNNVSLAGKIYSTISRFMGVKLVFRMPASIDQNGPYVFIGNHQNTFDIFSVCGAARPGTVTIGKKSLKWIPIFGWVYWLSGNILIDRQNISKAHGTLEAAAKKIRQRRLSVWMFPEGTRSNGRGLLPFKTGAFRLAQLTKEPVVMICASSLHNKVNWNRWDNGTVIVEMQQPVELDDSRSTKEWAKYFHQQMDSKIKQLDAEVAEIDNAG